MAQLRSSILAIFCLGLATVLSTLALPQAVAEETHGGWYATLYLRFNPAHREEALTIIREHFVPTDQAIGRKVIAFEPTTGEWDQVVFFPITFTAEGYDTVPPWSEWWAELAKREGGEAQAQQLFREYLGMTEMRKWELAKLVIAPGVGE